MYRRHSRHPGFAPHATRYAGRERTIDRASFSETTAAHLFDCLRGATTPAPLAAIVTKSAPRPQARLAVAGAAAVALVFLTVATCVGNSAPSHWSAAGCAVLAAITGMGVLEAIRVRRSVAIAVHLFPFDVVDVSAEAIRVVPLATARDVRVLVDAAGAGVEVVRADGLSYRFPAVDEAHAQGLHAEILEAIASVEALGDRRDDTVLGPIDPFVEFRTGEWPSGGTKRAPSRPHLGRAAVALAGAAAALLGLVDFHYAARADDDARFASANALGTVASYRHYLATGGGRYTEEVVGTLIPRLELRVAILGAPRLADVESLESFIASHPGSVYADVARAELATKVPGVSVASP